MRLMKPLLAKKAKPLRDSASRPRNTEDPEQVHRALLVTQATDVLPGKSTSITATQRETTDDY